MTELDRRKLLRRTGAAMTATGVGTLGTTGSVAAHYDTPMIETRGHFDDSCDLNTWETEASFDTDGSVPCIDTGCVNDLAVFVHGWNSTHSDAVSKTDDCAHSLYDNENYEYPGDVVGFSWESNEDWGTAKCIARDNGPKLGNALYQLKSDGVDYLRVVTHSLGVQVLLSAIRWLRDFDDWNSKLRTVHLLGAAQDNEAPTDESDWTQENYWAIRYETDALFNYYNRDDTKLETYFTDTALGNEGHDTDYDVPCNYTDFDATDQVDGHSDYLASLGAEMMDHIKYSDYYDCS
jgi:esterase/lipase superfamily enzyme